MENQQIRDFVVEKIWQFREHFQREQLTAGAEIRENLLLQLKGCKKTGSKTHHCYLFLGSVVHLFLGE